MRKPARVKEPWRKRDFDKNILMICPNCGYHLGVGKYEPLLKRGPKSINCESALRLVPTNIADQMLADIR